MARWRGSLADVLWPQVGGEARVDLDRFWELVEAAALTADGDRQAQAERLEAMLEQLAPEEIVSFERHFTQRLAKAYRWDLWGWPTNSTGAAPTTASFPPLLAAGAGPGHLGGGACRSGLADRPPPWPPGRGRTLSASRCCT
jgi:hypothetical protein